MIRRELDPFFGRHYISFYGSGEEPFIDMYALYWFTILFGMIWLPSIIREIRNGQSY